MPILYPYRLFISHAWDYNEDYYRLISMFDAYPNFDYKNYSVPKHDPFDSMWMLRQKLTNQINPTQVVVVLAGMYAAHSDWIDYEIDEAVRLGKSIIGVRPWGQERIPSKVQKCATQIHGWNVAPIVESIRRLA